MHRLIKIYLPLARQSPPRKNSILALLRPEDVKSRSLIRQWRNYPKSISDNPCASRHVIIMTPLANTGAKSPARMEIDYFGLRHLNAAILPCLSRPTIPDGFGARLIIIVSGSIIVTLGIILPSVITILMFFYTLEETTGFDVLDTLGVWPVVADITGEHKSLVIDQPRKQGSPAHPVIENDEIRLLILGPGRSDALLECQLVRCRVSADTGYEALSYAWGNTDSPRMLKCNGEMIRITQNLESALRHIRHPLARRILWVDAVCIDQDDAEERGHQVQLMGRIFSRAERVIVWLGEETADVKGAFSIRANQDYFLGPEGIALDSFEQKQKPTNLDFTMDTTAIALSDGNLLPLVKLLERPWFRRLWVLQEAALAQAVVVQCGKKRLRWDDFSNTLSQLKRKGIVFDHFTPKAAMGVETVLEIERIRSGDRQTLLSILIGTCAAECCDLRDKVYGVLSLAKDYGPRETKLPAGESRVVLGPDYTISVIDTFIRLAVWGILVYGAPDILSCTSRTDEKPLSELNGLPSWVPDWTRLDNDMPFMRYESCRIPKEEALFVCDNPIIHHGLNLEIPALYIDSIAQVGRRSRFKKTPFGKLWEEGDDEPSKVIIRIHEWSDETARAMHDALEWIYDCKRLASSTRTGQASLRDDLERYWRTLTAGMDGKRQIVSEEFDRDFQIYTEFLQACINVYRLGGSDLIVPRSQINTVGQIEAALHMID